MDTHLKVANKLEKKTPASSRSGKLKKKELVFQCDKGGKALKHKHSLDRHKNSQVCSKQVTAAHEKYPRKECFYCGKSVYNIKRHTKIYLGIKKANAHRGNALKGVKICSQISFYDMTGVVHHDHCLGTEGS
eukprot:157208-Ditylum_brightwellii.AAC.1